MSVDDRLAELGIALPATAAPVANYVSTRRAGNLLFVSGHVCRRDGAIVSGKVGDDIDTQTGYDLARLAALDVLGTVRAAEPDDSSPTGWRRRSSSPTPT